MDNQYVCVGEIDPLLSNCQCLEASGTYYVIMWYCRVMYHSRMLSQRGDSPFVYSDGAGWPASLPYIRKIHVSVAIHTQSGIRLHERVPMVKMWGSSTKLD